MATKLLVQQQIHFIPSMSIKSSPFGARIGNLMITSYFAASDVDQETFYIYESITIPSEHGTKRVKLAQAPAYIGLRPQTK